MNARLGLPRSKTPPALPSWARRTTEATRCNALGGQSARHTLDTIRGHLDAQQPHLAASHLHNALTGKVSRLRPGVHGSEVARTVETIIEQLPEGDIFRKTELVRVATAWKRRRTDPPTSATKRPTDDAPTLPPSDDRATGAAPRPYAEDEVTSIALNPLSADDQATHVAPRPLPLRDPAARSAARLMAAEHQATQVARNPLSANTRGTIIAPNLLLADNLATRIVVNPLLADDQATVVASLRAVSTTPTTTPSAWETRLEPCDLDEETKIFRTPFLAAS